MAKNIIGNCNFGLIVCEKLKKKGNVERFIKELKKEKNVKIVVSPKDKSEYKKMFSKNLVHRKNIILFDIKFTEKNKTENFHVLYDGNIIGILHEGNNPYIKSHLIFLSIRDKIKEIILNLFKTCKTIHPCFSFHCALIFKESGSLKKSELDYIEVPIKYKKNILPEFIKIYLDIRILITFSIFEFKDDLIKQYIKINKSTYQLYSDLKKFYNISPLRLYKKLKLHNKMIKKLNELKFSFIKLKDDYVTFCENKKEFKETFLEESDENDSICYYIKYFFDNISKIQEYFIIKPNEFYEDTKYIDSKISGYSSNMFYITFTIIGTIIGALATLIAMT